MLQFQFGMSIARFTSHIGTEAHSAKAICVMRLSDGFHHLRWKRNPKYAVGLGAGKRARATGCRHQASLAVAVFTQFLGVHIKIWILGTQKPSEAKIGVSELDLKGGLGVSYSAARLQDRRIGKGMGRRRVDSNRTGAMRLNNSEDGRVLAEGWIMLSEARHPLCGSVI